MTYSITFWPDFGVHGRLYCWSGVVFSLDAGVGAGDVFAFNGELDAVGGGKQRRANFRRSQRPSRKLRGLRVESSEAGEDARPPSVAKE